MLFCFGWCLKRKLHGLVCLSVFAWLLCPCCLSVRLCSLVFLCLAVFRCYCSACVWAAGCVAARLVAAVHVFWGSLLCFLPPPSCPRGLRWLVSLQVSPWFISCHDMFWLHASPALFSWAGRVCGPSQQK